MANKDLKVGILLSAVNRASGTLRTVNKDLAAIQLPAKRLRREFGLFNQLSGLRDVGAGLRNVGREAGLLSVKLAGLAGVGGFLFKREFIDAADQFERFQIQLEGLTGSSDKAREAMDWVKQFAKDTPLELDGVMDSFVKLKAFGMDPMNGTLQSLVDINAKFGGSQERLDRVILAVGQAWTKQKLQGEEILQLVEAGIPVWDLLSESTGKSVGQLQKMSSAGHLTRKAIQLLVEAMGKSAVGAAKAQMRTWNGMMSTLGDSWLNFKIQVMDGGLFAFLKGNLERLNTIADRMAADGSLAKWAKKTGDFLEEGFRKGYRGIVDLVRGVRWAAGKVGGYTNLMKIAFGGLALIMTGPLILATVQLGGAIVKLGALALAAMGPWGWLAAAIGAAIYAVWKNWDNLTKNIKFVWDSTVAGLLAGIEGAKAGIIGVFREIGDAWDNLIGRFKNLPAPLRFAVGGIPGLLAGGESAPSSDGTGLPSRTQPTGALSDLRPSQIKPFQTAGRAESSQVGGQIRIQIDSEGRPRVREIRSDNPRVPISVNTGLTMVAP